MQIPIFQVDAFTDRLFSGNPAAVCLLDDWLPDAALQAIAAENNLSETAFLVRHGTEFALRWFTPKVEVDLCGHATLASAHVVLHRLKPGRESVAFHTNKAGILTVSRDGALLTMDFPARPAKPADAPAGLVGAIGRQPQEILVARDYMLVYRSADEVRELSPDFGALAQIDCWAVIVTAPGENGVDFVSRFFAPAKGIDEDPVTGSAHCTLAPYWAARLGKTKLEARQISSRGGVLSCTASGDRVSLAGKSVLYLEGTITI